MPPRSSPPPPPPPRPSRPPHRGRHFELDKAPLDAALAPIVPDADDRRFVLRCVLDEGPRHHRGASWALLRMLAEVLDALGGADPAIREIAAEPIVMRLPPNVAAAAAEPEFPITIPTQTLNAVLTSEEAKLALECLRDGPPHHALANATMAWMIEAIFQRLTPRPPAARPSSARPPRAKTRE